MPIGCLGHVGRGDSPHLPGPRAGSGPQAGPGPQAEDLLTCRFGLKAGQGPQAEDYLTCRDWLKAGCLAASGSRRSAPNCSHGMPTGCLAASRARRSARKPTPQPTTAMACRSVVPRARRAEARKPLLALHGRKPTFGLGLGTGKKRAGNAGDFVKNRRFSVVLVHSMINGGFGAWTAIRLGYRFLYN